MEGFSIDSHGASHAALAIFIKDVLQSSPIGSEYRNTPYGKSNILSIQEIKYQLVESYEAITHIIGYSPTFFLKLI